MSISRALCSTAAVLLLSACINLAPEYQRPASPVPDTFSTTRSAAEGRAATEIGWREFFTDPRLQQLIAMALDNNRDLRRAVWRIEEARGLYRIQRSERLPMLDAVFSRSRTRSQSPVAPLGTTALNTQYQIGLAITAFELDLFSRVRNASDSAFALYAASIETQRATQLSLVAQVARAYLGERAFAEQLALAENTLRTRESALDLTRQRFDAGATSALDFRQAQSLVESARVSVAQLRRQRAQSTNALSFLVGAPLGELPPPVALEQQSFSSGFAAGLPSESLIARPDVRSAEAQLISSYADIGVARAAFFPRISLTASAGRVSPELDRLFSHGTGVWSFVPQLLQPLFTAGRNRGNLDVAIARREIAVAEYERAIQNAFREVADALVARDALEDELAAQARLVEAERARIQLTEQLFRAGVSGFLEYLDAQRQLFAAEQALVQTRLARSTAAVDLYIALGGGLR